MSLRTIIERYAKGLPAMGNVSEPLYDEDDNQLGINIKALDLVDLQELKADQEHFITNYYNDENRKKALEKAAAKEMADRKLIEDYEARKTKTSGENPALIIP